MNEENENIICLLDVLGFESLFNKLGLESIETKYKELIEIVEQQNIGLAFTVGPEGHPVIGFAGIESAYFSDSIIFWCKYDIIRLEILLQCMCELLCKSIEIGLPLRGSVSVGKVKIDKSKSIFLGQPIITAARAEVVQKWIGITLSKIFNDKPYNGGFKADVILQYDKHIKEGGQDKVIPLVIDFPRHWRLKRGSSLIEAIDKLNDDERYADYYNNTIAFVKYSEENHDWWMKHPEYIKELNRRKLEESKRKK
ncbi:MAG: hypothetical protein M1480_20690 [Bacteroidetes bacterium]|nr:hypothetical protein [Bacteroidota bacterium]